MSKNFFRTILFKILYQIEDFVIINKEWKVERMNGKKLKVVEYNLSFGSNERLVNVFGCFKHKKNGNQYLIYADCDTTYNIVYYGSSHLKENSILSMECKSEKDEEAIKEYIFKVTNKENLNSFEMISLENITGIEIISSNKLEVKSEVLAALVDLTIPKPITPESQNQEQTTKKKSSKKGLILLLLLAVIGVGGYLYANTLTSDQKGITKSITCTKEYNHNTLNAKVKEESIYYFSPNEQLQNVQTTTIYQFLQKEDYQDFMNKGTIYKYMPDADTTGGFSQDDANNSIKFIEKTTIDSGYKEPTSYEEVFSYYRKEGYTCNEELENQ